MTGTQADVHKDIVHTYRLLRQSYASLPIKIIAYTQYGL